MNLIGGRMKNHGSRRTWILRIWDEACGVFGQMLFSEMITRGHAGYECKNRIHLFRWVVFVHFRRFILHGAVHF